MRAYELPVKIASEGTIRLPEDLAELLPRDRMLRLIILVDESEAGERADWAKLAAEQFLAGYAAADAVYDKA
ncbi:MAG: hypothetical protein GXY76_11175 [Chloroflexi bacterium]|nr:hypothetical protein [Chloroflexota bacterium]